jgi:hypothetical protein
MTYLQVLTLVIVCIVGFALLWVSISKIVAYLSGWHLLAKRFQATDPFSGRQIRLWHASMRFFTRYDNVIYMGTNPSGLHLRMNLLFRIGHPLLLIPWSEIDIGEESRSLFFIPVIRIHLGRNTRVPFRIYGRNRFSFLVSWRTGASYRPGWVKAARFRARPTASRGRVNLRIVGYSFVLW